MKNRTLVHLFTTKNIGIVLLLFFIASSTYAHEGFKNSKTIEEGTVAIHSKEILGSTPISMCSKKFRLRTRDDISNKRNRFIIGNFTTNTTNHPINLTFISHLIKTP